jgi:2-(1,2-epoxy-1,2-dihydrophenyl)acetyl-CoA isomerase
LLSESYKLAQRLLDGPLHAIGVTKELMEREASMGLEQALELEAEAQAQCMERPEFQEGYNAFIEKRRPLFNRW